MAIDKKNGYFELTKNPSARQEYHFTLRGPNEKALLSSESYTSSDGARNGIKSVRENGTNLANFDKQIAKDGSFYYELIAQNNKSIGTSPMYKTEAQRDHAIDDVMKYVKLAVLVDHTVPAKNGGATTSQPHRSRSNHYA